MAMIYIIVIITVFCIHYIHAKHPLLEPGQEFPLDIPELIAETMSQTSPPESYLKSAQFLITNETRQVFNRFVKYKKEYGTDSEKTYYKHKTGSDIIQKCIQKREIVFIRGKGQFKSGWAYYPPWGYIGQDIWENAVSEEAKERLINEYFNENANKERAENLKMGTKSEDGEWKIGADYVKFLLTRFNINYYLSLHEMQLSALLLVWAKTEFFNDGQRFNNGIIQDVDEIPRTGVMVGAVGPRNITGPNVMDNVLYLNNSDHDRDMAQIIFGKELYEESIKYTQLWEYKELYNVIYVAVYVDLLKLRYKRTYEAYFMHAIKYIAGDAQTLNMSVTGLGPGVWAINNAEQSKMIVEVIAEVLKEFKAKGIVLRQVISVIHFIYFGDPSAKAFADACKATPTGEFKVIHEAAVVSIGAYNLSVAEYECFGINISFSTNNPSSYKGPESSITVNINDDPAAASSSPDYVYTQNALINITVYPKLSNDVKIVDVDKKKKRRLITDNKESNDSTVTTVSSLRMVVIMLLSFLASMFIAYYLFSY